MRETKRRRLQQQHRWQNHHRLKHWQTETHKSPPPTQTRRTRQATRRQQPHFRLRNRKHDTASSATTTKNLSISSLASKLSMQLSSTNTTANAWAARAAV